MRARYFSFPDPMRHQKHAQVNGAVSKIITQLRHMPVPFATRDTFRRVNRSTA